MNNAIARTINLQKTYSPGKHNEVKALKGVSTEFNSGEFIGVIGPSGSGKSTFMHLLGTLDSPTMDWKVLCVSLRIRDKVLSLSWKTKTAKNIRMLEIINKSSEHLILQQAVMLK